ncbi:MAG: hypothetical protein CW716_12150 [Candidatus Bathyarchaeum sp.]|nr:MAG: hypothetical protein CW716_12150 [Candidatus Bathyarchaeum sp.]
MESKKGYKTVDEYIASFPSDVQSILQELRKAIKNAAPDALECISYQMPSYKQNRYLLSFAAWKKHIGLYVATTTVLEAYKKELAPYEVSKATIKFPLDKPLPFDLVKKIVKLRLKEDRTQKKTAKWFCEK